MTRALVDAKTHANDTYDGMHDIWEGVNEAYHCIRQRKAAGGQGWTAGGDYGRIINIRRDSQVEEWLTIHPTGRLEHHYKNGNCSRDQWIDLGFVKNYWPHLITEVDAAIAALGTEEAQ
jgi:hypothetical protein